MHMRGSVEETDLEVTQPSLSAAMMSLTRPPVVVQSSPLVVVDELSLVCETSRHQGASQSGDSASIGGKKVWFVVNRDSPSSMQETESEEEEKDSVCLKVNSDHNGWDEEQHQTSAN
ncbi:hypothetical protein C0Q70_09672 [Pomacea canaliculata]|uniref:Uncharacterized protein n=1 Tax=Pomacea canaliculata TaxID=400727 RepID=A0A2T7PAH0_POMCA|nr:hypothetical protein C0Q70_09672 [Pomacea canaliculata]